MSDDIYITVTPSVTNITLGNDTTYCGNFIRTFYTGFSSSTWSTGQTGSQITVSTPGTYWVSVSNSCSSKKDTIVLSQQQPLQFSLGPDTSICAGSSVQLSPNAAGTRYLWSTGDTTQKITVSNAGYYSLEITSNGCKSTDAINVSVTQLVNPFTLGRDTFYCGNFSSTLRTGSSTTLWSTGQSGSQITITQPGVYWAKVYNQCNSVFDTIKIDQRPVPVVKLRNDTSVCNGNNVLIEAYQPNASYVWNTGDTTHSIVAGQSQTYNVRVTVNGCSANGSMKLSLLYPPVPFELGNDTTYCGAFSRLLKSNSSTTQWNDSITAAQITVSKPGTFWAINKNTCGIFRDTITIKRNPLPVVNIGRDTSFCIGEVLLNAYGAGNIAYLWNNGARDSAISTGEFGSHWVIVTDTNNCMNSDTVLLTDLCVGDLYLPTAFSPNNDGRNDVFFLLGNIDYIKLVHFEIFDRWGEMVWEAKNIRDKWDGTYKGKESQLDTYVWRIEYHMIDSEEIKTKKGTVTLLR
jgi:gliding motility-associated-like protein